MSRCAGCNVILKDNEIIWRKDIEQWEDLCRRCRHIALDLPEDAIEVIDAVEDSNVDLPDISDIGDLPSEQQT